MNHSVRRAFAPFRDPLIALYAEMDAAYSTAAGRLGFVCCGCEDTCCRSRFYHHTYLEYAYLLEGMKKLDRAQKDAARESAATVAAEYSADAGRQRTRPLCPLNFGGRCGLYAYRPMICRLHGIPHVLKRSGRDPIYGPGCEAFERRGGLLGNADPLDRTPYYLQMAALEIAMKKAAGLFQRLKMTIADMILSSDGV